MRFIVMFALAALSVSACSRNESGPPPVPVEGTERVTNAGKVVGTMTEAGAYAWRGIPFAAAPEGERRWRAPAPVAPWDGIRETLAFKPRCAQVANAFSPELEPGSVVGAEDCLYLNVFSPVLSEEEAQGTRLPVMMWIHGGGNVWGSADQYDPSNLALAENVIVVTVQYRLGPLGWFSHPALQASDTDEPADALAGAANFGTLDLVAALEWIKDNAASFGGDPQNVTIFGESAGGHNVSTLLASPMAKGLFHRAIIQSGSFDSVSVAEAQTGDKYPNPSTEIVAKLGVSTADELREVSAADLFNAYMEGDETGFLNLPLIIEDGVVLPDFPLRDAFSSVETFNAVPIITGTNRDEMKLFQLMDPRLTKRFFGILIVARNQGLYDASAEYQSRVWRARAVDGPAQRMAKAGHGDVYAYRFDWDEAGKLLISDFAKLFGAAHAAEIPFVFNRFEFFGPLDQVIFTKKTLESRTALAKSMGRYWASFARTGVPASASDPAWSAYAEGNAALMRFDTVKDGGPEMINGEDNLELIFADLQNDKRITNDEKCAIVFGLLEWIPEFDANLIAQTGCTAS